MVSQARRICSNDYLITLVSNGLLICIGIATGILTARLLGPEGRGSLAAILVWTNAIVTLGVIGIPHTLTYYSGREPAKRGLLWQTALNMAVVQGVFLSIGAASVLPFILREQPAATRTAAMWFAFSILIHLFQLYQLALLQGAGWFRLWNLLRLLYSGLYLGLLVIFSSGGLTLYEPLIAQVVAMVIQTMVVTFLCYRTWGMSQYESRGSFLRPVLAFAIPTALASSSQLISAQVDQLALTQFVSPAELGLYTVAVGLAHGVLPASSAVSWMGCLVPATY